MKPHQSHRYTKHPKSTVCFNCGRDGHIASQCDDKTQNRMEICWTCGKDDHIRNSKRCPGNPHPENWFCSFCKTQGISTELCGCNDVKTRKLFSTRVSKGNQPGTSGIRKESTTKHEVPVKRQKMQRFPERYPSMVVKVHNPRKRIPSSDWLWAIKVEIDGNNYIAQISQSKTSFINPERVQMKKMSDIPTTIANKTRNICYTRDTTIATPVVLGEDAVIIFGLRAFVDEDQTLPYFQEEYPESDSDEETIRKKPHPNRRLEADN